MTIANLGTALALSSFLFLATPAELALAHTQDGSLGDDPGATDFYQVTCNDDGSGEPASMAFQVTTKSAGAPLVSVVVFKPFAAFSSTDPTNGDANGGPLVFLNGAGGVYNVFLHKTVAGAVNYTLTFHCMTDINGGGLHTGTTIVFRQNQ